MYVYTHYNTYSNVGGTTNGSGGKFGTLNFSNIMVGSEDEAIETLLEWNELDPVDEIERTRNDAVCEIQGNRNPFVDNESYADAIWGDGTVEEKPLTLNKTTLEMSVGETQTIIATTTESGTVSWTTSDPSVATVSGGTIKAVAEGSATITATIGQYTATCKVTVTNTVAVDKTSVTLMVGESQTITATASGAVTWTSQDPTIATVDNGVITAVAKGKTVVTVTCGTAKTQINVTVIDESSGNTGIITITMDSFINYGGAYNYYNWEVDGVEGLAYLYKSNNNEMQFNKNKTAYYLASTSALPGRIVSVTVELSSGSDRDWKLLTSDSPYGKVTGAPTNGTDHGTKLVTTNGATWNIETGDTYFALSYMAASGACYLKSITVEYELGGSEGVTSAASDFIDSVEAIGAATSKSEKFDAIKNSIALYNNLTDEEKATVAEQYEQLQTAIEDYNTVVQDVNSQVTKSLKSILLTTAFMSMALAGLLYLLERNRL